MRSIICAAHHHECMVPVESHHIWPLGMHGPDTSVNRVQLCANAHSDIHYLLSLYLKHGFEDVPWNVRRTYGPMVREYAFQGYAAIMSYGTSRSVKIMGQAAVAQRLDRG